MHRFGSCPDEGISVRCLLMMMVCDGKQSSVHETVFFSDALGTTLDNGAIWFLLIRGWSTIVTLRRSTALWMEATMLGATVEQKGVWEYTYPYAEDNWYYLGWIGAEVPLFALW